MNFLWFFLVSGPWMPDIYFSILFFIDRIMGLFSLAGLPYSPGLEYTQLLTRNRLSGQKSPMRTPRGQNDGRNLISQTLIFTLFAKTSLYLNWAFLRFRGLFSCFSAARSPEVVSIDHVASLLGLDAAAARSACEQRGMPVDGSGNVHPTVPSTAQDRYTQRLAR